MPWPWRLTSRSFESPGGRCAHGLVVHSRAEDVTPLERVLDALTAKSCTPKQAGDYWQARCPAHDDEHPSLTVAANAKGDVLLKCHAGTGCPAESIVAALGLTMAD